MAYDEELAERVRELLPVEEKRMFGGLAFLVGGRMAVAVSGSGGLMVRVRPEEAEALRAEPGVGDVVMGGRGAMRGWLLVEPQALAEPAALARWVARGAASAASSGG